MPIKHTRQFRNSWVNCLIHFSGILYGAVLKANKDSRLGMHALIIILCARWRVNGLVIVNDYFKLSRLLSTWQVMHQWKKKHKPDCLLSGVQCCTFCFSLSFWVSPQSGDNRCGYGNYFSTHTHEMMWLRRLRFTRRTYYPKAKGWTVFNACTYVFMNEHIEVQNHV